MISKEEGERLTPKLESIQVKFVAGDKTMVATCHDHMLMSPRDGLMISYLAEGKKRIVEIGTFMGASAESILKTMHPEGHLISIDVPTCPPKYAAMFPTFVRDEGRRQRLEPYEGRFSIVLSDSITVSTWFPDKYFDMVYIDGDHTYDAVMRDIRAWLPKLRDGGYLCGHDLNVGCQQLTKAERQKRRHLDNDGKLHFGVFEALDDSFSFVERIGHSNVWLVEAPVALL